MTDYTIGAPPNLRSVDCCATCKHFNSPYRDCSKFRYVGDPPDLRVFRHDVDPENICDAFEREVRK